MSLAHTVLPCTWCEENKFSFCPPVGSVCRQFGRWGVREVEWRRQGTQQCHASRASMTAPACVTAAGGVLEWEKIEELGGNRD